MNRRTATSYVTVAERLGVSYGHLYHVLHLLRSSPALLLTIERLYPELIEKQDGSVKYSLHKSCDFHREAYRWDSRANRYVLKDKYAKYR